MKKVLIIDENKSIRKMLKTTLEKSGYEVNDACDSQTGLESYRKVPVDIVVVNILVPELRGLRTIIKLKKEFPSARIIAISCQDKKEYYTDYNPLQSAILFGAFGAFTVPVETVALLATIKRLFPAIPRYMRRESRHLDFRVRSKDALF
ncbi:MAG: response regulator [Proteobacteria bacterium]|nr:response regulator [Pseudomonadota bacterium]